MALGLAYLENAMFGGEFIEAAEHVVEKVDDIHRFDSAADRREAHHVREQDRHAFEFL